MYFDSIGMLKLIFVTLFGALSLSLCIGQNSWNMSLASRYDNDSLPQQSGVAYSDIWAYAYPDGKEIAIIGTLDSIWIYEITDPYKIRRVFSFAGGYRTLWREFKTYSHYLYAITDAVNEGLTVFDLGNSPDSIQFVQRDLSVFIRSHMLFADTSSGHLYITGARDSIGPVDLIMMDLNADPAHPSLIRKIDLPGNYVHDVFVRNDTAYCSHGTNGLYIYKIESNGTYMELGSLTTYQQQGYNHSSWLHENGKYLIFADETHNTSLKLVDLRDISNPRVMNMFRSALEAPDDTASMAHNPYFKGDYAFVSYYHDGVVVFNCSNPLDVQIVAYYDTEPGNTNYNKTYEGSWGVYPYLPSGTIVASDIQNGLFVLYLDLALALEEVQMAVENIANSFKINWSLSSCETVDNLCLYRSRNHAEFSKIAEFSCKDDHSEYWDRDLQDGDYAFQLRWNSKEQPRSSAIHLGKISNYCYSINANHHLVTSCPDKRIREVKIFSVDGKELIKANEIILPFPIPVQFLGGLNFLQLTDEYGHVSVLKLL